LGICWRNACNNNGWLRTESKYRAVFCSGDVPGADFFWDQAEGGAAAKKTASKRIWVAFSERETSMDGNYSITIWVPHKLSGIR
jgi:hypothetical protein